MTSNTKRLIWLMRRSYYPTFVNEDGKGFAFGTLPRRRSVRRAIDDAMELERKRKSK